MEVDGGSGEATRPHSVMTVLGPLDPQKLSGAGLCSEHLLYDLSPFVPAATDHENHPLRMVPVSLPVLGELYENPLASLDNVVMKSESSAEEELRAFAKHGGSIVVDTTVTGILEVVSSMQQQPQQCIFFRSVLHPRSHILL